METVPVKVSGAMARQVFHGCATEYIRDTCHARCCESSTSPTGTRIALAEFEQARFQEMGLTVLNGMLQPRSGQKKCPLKHHDNLCGVHDTAFKPFGCIASPFILNAKDTLIVRNRYRLLKCYRDGTLPAYKAFRASLDLLFGPTESHRICQDLDDGAAWVQAQMLSEAYRLLKANAATHAQEVSHAK